MAKDYGIGKRARRGMGKYIRGNVDEVVNMATLSSRTVVVQNFGETVNERTRVTSLVGRWSLDDLTPLANQGPIMCGLAHSDYTAAEVEEWIENTGSWNEGDLVNQEIGQRKIRMVGIFQKPGTIVESSVLNDGKPIKTKLNWTLLQGQTLEMWAYNLGSVDISTTVPQMHLEGHANLWPL